MRSRRPASTDPARLVAILDRFPEQRVLVVGDIIADEFISGRIARVSREAPVLILQYDATDIVPGGAGNAANNVAAAGAAASLVGLTGRDEQGRRLLASFNGRVDVSGVLRQRDWPTPTKTRILAGGVHSAKQQVVRIDREPQTTPDAAAREAMLQAATRHLPDATAVILSDYGLGSISPALARALRTRSRESSRQRPILIDSRYDLPRYRSLAACTPNESEVEQWLGLKIGDDLRVLERAGRTLLDQTRMRAVLITRGSRGMALFEPGRPTVQIPIFGSDQVTDVTGAGDTVIATVSLALASGATFEEAARLANYAGGLVVMKRGTATVTAGELRDAIRSDLHG